MNANAITFLENIKKHNKEDISKYLAVATGIAIARLLPLPESLLQGQDDTFNQDLIKCARDKVSIINELCIMDTTLALAVAKGVYQVRFRAVYNDIIHVSKDECLWCDVFGISVSLSNIDISDLDKECVIDIMGIVSSILIKEEK